MLLFWIRLWIFVEEFFYTVVQVPGNLNDTKSSIHITYGNLGFLPVA